MHKIQKYRGFIYPPPWGGEWNYIWVLAIILDSLYMKFDNNPCIKSWNIGLFNIFVLKMTSLQKWKSSIKIAIFIFSKNPFNTIGRPPKPTSMRKILKIGWIVWRTESLGMKLENREHRTENKRNFFYWIFYILGVQNIPKKILSPIGRKRILDGVAIYALSTFGHIIKVECGSLMGRRR